MASSLLLLLLLVCVPLCLSADAEYSVPEPYIQALRPKGLRFSIPDEPGIELFAVHANINKQLRDLEAGELSKDILQSHDGRWVFEDRNVRVTPGDRLHFWLYVKRDGLGYRRDGGSFTVTELVDPSTPATPPAPCAKGCLHEEAPSSERLTEQRLRHQQELHEQRLRHAEELHRERLRQLQQHRGGHAAANASGDSDVQDVSVYRRIGN